MTLRHCLSTSIRPLAAASRGRPAAAPLARFISTRRSLTTTLARRDDAGASHASVDESFTMPYPDAKERDVGHSTTGPERVVSRHKRRTLGSLSMEGKVCVVTRPGFKLIDATDAVIDAPYAFGKAESGSNAIAVLDLDEELSKQSAKEIADWFVEHGKAQPHEIQAIGVGCDVSSEEAVKKAMATVYEKFGRIDVLVNSAGIVHNYPALEYPADKYKQLMDINLNGSFFTAREAARSMIKNDQPGSIILVGSMSGKIVNVPQAQAPYNASKAGVHHLAASLAVEWAPSNIRVNALAPGYMATSLTRAILDKNPVLRDTWTQLTPMHRLGEPEDLKGAIIYLASDASAYTTGTVLDVDGGYICT